MGQGLYHWICPGRNPSFHVVHCQTWWGVQAGGHEGSLPGTPLLLVINKLILNVSLN